MKNTVMNTPPASILLVLLLSALVACGGGEPSPGPGSPTIQPLASDLSQPSNENGREDEPTTWLLEIDRMQGTPDLLTEQEIDGKNVSLTKIFSDAGLELETAHDQSNIPQQPSLRLADLHGLMTTFSSVDPAEGQQKVYALIVTEDQDDPGTLGIMFDFEENDDNDIPREAFAVFTSAHKGLDGGVTPEMLLTTAHELAHCFNLHHPDWEGSSFQQDATIESYSMTDSVRWSLSSQSVAHLRDHPDCLVWPGGAAQEFGIATAEHLEGHKSSPNEAFSVADANQICAPQRGPSSRRAMAARTEPVRQAQRVLTSADTPLRLELRAPKTTYVIGEAVVLTAILHNAGTAEVEVMPLLDPNYQFLNIEIQRPGTEEFQRFRPAVLAEGRGTRSRRLAPGEAVLAEAKIFFGAQGWTFTEPGSYAVRADFGAGDALGSEERVASAELVLEIQEPRRPADRRARGALQDENGQLSTEAGLYLLFEGGDHLSTGARKVRRVTDEPESAQAPAAQLAAGMAALYPSARRGVSRGAPQIEEAKRYLSQVLSSDLPMASVVRAQRALVDELESQGQPEEADRVREQTMRELNLRLSGEPEGEELRRKVREEN